MRVVVFDTNVIVAGLVAEGLCRELVEIRLPEHIAILPRVLRDELVEKLRDKFDLSADDLQLLDLYRRHAIWAQPLALDTRVCRDPDDDWVLPTHADDARDCATTPASPIFTTRATTSAAGSVTCARRAGSSSGCSAFTPGICDKERRASV